MIRKFVDRNEKGAVIVFLAITLPLLLVLVGGAIDFGNAYIHKSRLQNTADAAALAEELSGEQHDISGAYVYTGEVQEASMNSENANENLNEEEIAVTGVTMEVDR